MSEQEASLIRDHPLSRPGTSGLLLWLDDAGRLRDVERLSLNLMGLSIKRLRQEDQSLLELSLTDLLTRLGCDDTSKGSAKAAVDEARKGRIGYVELRCDGSPRSPRWLEAVVIPVDRKQGPEDDPREGAGRDPTPAKLSSKTAATGVLVLLGELDRQDLDDETRLRSHAFEAAVVPIVFLTVEGTITSVNAATLRLWGYKSRGELVGKPLAMLSSSAEAVDAVLQTIRDNGHWVGEHTARASDGRLLSLLVSAALVRAPDGEPIGIVSSAIDLSELRRSEAKLERREAVFEAIVGAVPDALILSNPAHEITFCNPGVTRLFGYPCEALLGRPLSTLMGSGSPIAGKAAVPFARSDGSQQDDPSSALAISEDEFLRQDGSRFPGEAVTVPVLDHASRTLGHLMLIRDISERRRALEALAENEAFTRAVLGSLTAHIAVLDHEGTIVAVNPAWERFARDQGGVLNLCGVGRNYLEVCRATTDEGATIAHRVADGLQAILRGESRFFTLEYPCHSPSEPRWYILSATPLSHGHGGVVVSHVDITRRRESERRLRESEERFDLAIRGSADGIWDWPDLTDDHQWWSPRLYELLGYHPAELEARMSSLWQIMHPDDVEEARVALQAQLKHDVRYEVRHRLRTGSGQYRWFRARAAVSRGPDGTARRFTGCMEDIQDRVIAEDQETALGHIVEESRNEIFIFDVDSLRFRYVNRSGRLNTGYSRSELSSLTPLDLKPEFTRPTFGELVRPLREHREAEVVFEARQRRKDGTAYDVEVFLQLSRYRGEACFVAIIQDVSERKRAEAERRSLERRLLEIAESEQRRIGRDLHDGVGQELTGIAMLAESLKVSLGDGQSPVYQLAEKLGRFVAQSLDQVRRLSRGLNPVDVDPSGLHAALTGLATQTTQPGRVNCRFHGDPDIRVDDSETATHLFRIAQESIANAIRHGRARNIDVELDRRGGSLELRILDDGCGLPDEVEAGQGIGMRSMHYRADLINARLTVSRRESGGTAVLCRLPES